jgi:hypothetical protein
MITEIITAVISGSLALLSDAGHMLSDIGAIAIALWAARLTRRRPQGSWTWGWKRAEIMSAAVNGVTLLVVAILVGIEAVRRLVTPPAVGGPGHCHSRPHPDRPICPNRPVPTPHHPIPPLGTQPVQRRPHRPSHRPLTISEAPLTRRQSGSVFEPVTNTRPSTALRPSFLTKTDQWEAFFPQNRTSAGARDPSPVKAP